MSLGLNESEVGPRIVDLADGRVLFLTAGRAYYLKDHAHGKRLETELKWTQRIATWGVLAAVLAAVWAKTWWVGLFAIPAFVLAVLAERFVVIGCAEATDPVARAEVTARSTAAEVNLLTHLIWTATPFLFWLVSAFLREKRGPMQLLEIAVACFALVAIVTRLWWQRRRSREEEIVGKPRGVADNTPIVPR